MNGSARRLFLRQRMREWIGHAGWHVLCLPVAISCLFPLVWMVSSSLKTQQTVFSTYSPQDAGRAGPLAFFFWLGDVIIPNTPQFANYALAWTKGKFGLYFFNSLLYTFIVVFGVVGMAALAAYAFSRFRFRGSDILYKLVLLTMLMPIPAGFVALYILLNGLGLIDQGIGQFLPRMGYILPQINAGLPLGIFILKPFFDKIPKELEESAEVDGCGVVGVFWYIMLPLARPALGVVALLTSLSAWNEFLLAYLVFSRHELMPLQRGLLAFHGAHLTDYPLLMAGMVISIIPILIIYLVMQRTLIQGITAGALKG